ncbi:MAG: alginate export family protein [Planctomycetes bacterium]|nr:alginate export family protein [Planctomycetota bacterium]
MRPSLRPFGWVIALVLACQVSRAPVVRAEQSLGGGPPEPEQISGSMAENAPFQLVSEALESESGADDGSVVPCPPKKLAALKAAAAAAYKDPFYDNDFKYLNDPCYDGWHLGERLKQLRACEDSGVLDIGGQYRLRFQDEQNMRGLGLTGLSDDFLLRRMRLYADWHVNDWLRCYAEYLSANSDFDDFPPRAIEHDPHEIQNLFVDARVWDTCDGDIWGRVGRQELLYGSQRLISPLDWANTRRTFDGAKLFYRGSDWNVDGFWVRPIFGEPESLNSPDGTQEFYALWGTYKGHEGHVYDLYWIGYHDYDSPFQAGRTFAFETVGGRWKGAYCGWLGEVEGGYQFGAFGDMSHSAGFFTLGCGRQLREDCWKPTLWAYYDWASGDDTIGNGFNQNFPLGHKYLGFMDFYARTNIEDLNFQLEMQPRKDWKLLLWWHIFHLQNGNDVPYRINGTPFVTTPGGSRYLGQELDFLATWNMTPHTSWLFGYSHYFTGSWYSTNPTPPPFTGDADFAYVQYQMNF